ncbi:MAG: ABC transporter ATP-binding protein [Sumerlaeia bacterium]
MAVSTDAPTPLRDRYPLLDYLALYRPYRGRVALAVSIACLKHAPVLLLPMYTAYIFDVAIPIGSVEDVLLCAVGMVAMLVANVCLHPIFIRLWSHARREVALDLRARVCNRIQQLVFSYYDTASSGRLHSKVMQDVEKLENLGRVLIDPLLLMGLTALAALSIVAFIEPIFCVVLVLALPICLLQRRLMSRRVEERFQTLRVEQEKLNAEVTEMIGMVPLARAHATEAEDLRRVDSRLGAVRDQGLRADWFQHLFQSQVWFTMQNVSVVVIVLGSLLVIWGRMSLGEVVMFMSLVMMSLGGINALFSQMEVFYGASEAMRSINEVLNNPQVEQNEGKPALPPLRGEIAFDAVTFAYPGTAEPVLRSASLTVEACQTVALVGPSGAGKSTFIKLLLGLYQPQKGAVRIDGYDLREADLRTLRRQVGVVTQETFLFNGTIGDNLCHGLGDVPRDRIEWAAEQANAHDFISALEKGYDTEIGDRGVRLSGGQKQRLSIARALLRNPRLLLLDEATSALDSESERLVQEALERLMDGRTTFLIAHRLSTVRHADRILVFDQGRIVEDGPHEELLARKGVYARLVELQTVA